MLLFILACSEVPEEALPTSGAMSVLTYNVHGLPSAITGDDTPARIEAIAPLLDGFDIVGLQEDFDDANHEMLAAASDHETQVRFSDLVSDDRYYGSGLSVFASFPLIETHHVHFTDCSGIVDGSSDCLASKGFQVIRLQLGAGELDVYNTHMEAGGGAEDNAARESNVLQLIDALQNYSADRAVLFVGDTNLHGGDPVDQPLVDQLLEEGQLTESCDVVSCPEPGRIDRIFIRNASTVTLTVVDWAVEAGFEDAAGVALSDHDPISVTVEWNVNSE